LRRRIAEDTLGEITREYSRQYGATDGIVGVGGTYALKPLGDVMVGASAGVGRFHADVSFHRIRAFRTSERLDYKQVNLALGVRF
jgi:hypothetical protein